MTGPDWSIVGYGGDPITDDPGVVATQIDHILGVAAAIRTQIDRMPSGGEVDALHWEDNAAAGSFKECCRKLPKDLGILEVRYTKVGNALKTFHATLVSTKATTVAELAKAQAAHNAVQTASAGVTAMSNFNSQSAQAARTTDASAAPGTPPATPAAWTGPDYHAQLTTAHQQLSQAKANIDRAVGQFRHASQAAAHAVSAAGDDSLKNGSGFFHWVGHQFESAAHWAASNFPIKAISGVLGTLSAITGLLSLLPIPIVQEVLIVATFALAGLTLLGDAITAVNDTYEGTFTWRGDGLNLGIDLATAGLAGAGVRGIAREAAAASEVTKAGSAAREADLAAREAAQAKTGAGGLNAANQAHLTNLTTGRGVLGALKVTGARWLGFTGRAARAADASQQALDDAARTEARLADAARLKAGDLATAKGVKAGVKATNIRVGLASGGAGVGASVHTANTANGANGGDNTINPAPPNLAVGLYRVTSNQLGDIGRGHDSPAGPAETATDLGAHIAPEPIASVPAVPAIPSGS